MFVVCCSFCVVDVYYFLSLSHFLVWCLSLAKVVVVAVVIHCLLFVLCFLFLCGLLSCCLLHAVCCTLFVVVVVVVVWVLVVVIVHIHACLVCSPGDSTFSNHAVVPVMPIEVEL